MPRNEDPREVAEDEAERSGRSADQRGVVEVDLETGQKIGEGPETSGPPPRPPEPPERLKPRFETAAR
jgi:hypothetical protein